MGEEIHFRTQPCLVVPWNCGRCQLFTDLHGTGASGRQWLGFVRGGLTLGRGQSLPRGLGGGTQMWRAGTASLWLLGCGSRARGWAGSWVWQSLLWFVFRKWHRNPEGAPAVLSLALTLLLLLCIQVALPTELW